MQSGLGVCSRQMASSLFSNAFYADAHRVVVYNFGEFTREIPPGKASHVYANSRAEGQSKKAAILA